MQSGSFTLFNISLQETAESGRFGSLSVRVYYRDDVKVLSIEGTALFGCWDASLIVINKVWFLVQFWTLATLSHWTPTVWVTPTSSSNCVRNISSRRAVPSKRKSSRKPSTPPSTNASSCSSVSLLSAAFLFFFHNKYIAFTFLVVSPLVSVVVRAHACTSRWWITIYWLRTTSQARLSFPWPIFLELVAKLWADLVRSPLSVSPSPTPEELGVSFFSIREPINCVDCSSCLRFLFASIQTHVTGWS